MLLKRIIPCLLIKDGGLVKTNRFKESTYVGDPINAVKIFSEKESDEILILDIEATKKKLIMNYCQIYLENVLFQSLMGGNFNT